VGVIKGFGGVNTGDLVPCPDTFLPDEYMLDCFSHQSTALTLHSQLPLCRVSASRLQREMKIVIDSKTGPGAFPETYEITIERRTVFCLWTVQPALENERVGIGINGLVVMDVRNGHRNRGARRGLPRFIRCWLVGEMRDCMPTLIRW
jgi:hypothetical protein